MLQKGNLVTVALYHHQATSQPHGNILPHLHYDLKSKIDLLSSSASLQLLRSRQVLCRHLIDNDRVIEYKIH